MMLIFVAIVAICGIFYELLIGTLSSYLIGNSVQQFSFVIGFFLSGMGIGAYFSRFLEKNAIKNFFYIEIILSILGASSVILLKFFYIYLITNRLFFQILYFLITISIGSLIGLEIPLVAEIYKKLKLKTNSIVSDIFTFDYIGGLIASLLFPLLLLPLLGLYNIAIFVGSINLLVAIMYLAYVRKKHKKYLKEKKYKFIILGVIIYFGMLLFFSNSFEKIYLQFYYKEPILETFHSPYQEIVLTKRGEDFRMYLNGHLQFLSLDEKRYHKALVNWPLNLMKKNNLEILILGGGDGLAARNLLETKKVSKIDLVELDPKIIEISKSQKEIVKLNKNSLNNEKINIFTEDAFQFLVKNTKKYDLIIADFPDPRDVGLAKLYSKEFYIMASGSLKQNGIFVTQASNAFFSNKAMFSIEKTMKNVFGNSLVYHNYLPSFGDWGFVIAGKNFEINAEKLCPKKACDFFDDDYLLGVENISENTLGNPKIIEYYGEGYKKFNL